jgi:hypothetical protein
MMPLKTVDVKSPAVGFVEAATEWIFETCLGAAAACLRLATTKFHVAKSAGFLRVRRMR